MAKSPPREISRLQDLYASRAASAARVVDCLRVQLSVLIDNGSVTLGVPMESRVKTWQSVSEKIERATDGKTTIDTIQDIAGIRIILLFADDIEKVDLLIKENLDVISYEDTATRLDDNQFGYKSNHYTVRIPPSWAQIPSYADISGEPAEIQVRTVAQHIWAAASHKLQYKNEVSVPKPLRRSINRISALLETVDLELSRVVSERISYKAGAEAGYADDEDLNVDLLAQILSEIYPVENKEEDDEEGLEELLNELILAGIDTPRLLKESMIPHLKWILKADSKRAASEKPEDWAGLDDDWARIQKGVFYNHLGLARVTLQEKIKNRAG